MALNETKELDVRVLERYSLGKLAPELNEDIYVITPDFVGVIDGATDKTGHVVEGMKGGRFVALAIANLHERGAIPRNVDILTWASLVTEEIDRELVRVSWPENVQRPAASVVMFNVFRKEIFRIGDCHYRASGMTYLGGKLIDDYIAGIRADHLKERLLMGTSVEEIQQNDTGRALIMDRLASQYRYANASEGVYAYPVFNGDPIPEHLIERPYPVPSGSLVIMTSDGFDFPADTLRETMDRQREDYEVDPLRIGLCGARPSPKGIVPGITQHDDQTYISFIV